MSILSLLQQLAPQIAGSVIGSLGAEGLERLGEGSVRSLLESQARGEVEPQGGSGFDLDQALVLEEELAARAWIDGPGEDRCDQCSLLITACAC